MAVPVAVQAAFELEPLAGETQVERGRSADRVRRTPRRPLDRPHRCLRRVGHAHRAVQVVDVHVMKHRCRAGAGECGVFLRVAAPRQCLGGSRR